MSSVVYDIETKAKVIKILKDNEIGFELTNYCGFEKII